MEPGPRFPGPFRSPQAKPVVIHTGIPATVGVQQFVESEAGKALDNLTGRVPAATGETGSERQQIVEPDARANQPLGALAVPADRDQQLQRADQLRCLPDPPGALLKRLANQPQVAVLEVAQAAVQHLGGGAAGGRHQPAFFEEIDAIAAPGESPDGDHSSDPATDDCDLHSTARVVPVNL